MDNNLRVRKMASQQRRLRVPNPETQLKCSSCREPWAADDIPGYFCAFSLPCGHMFCTKCTLLSICGMRRCYRKHCKEKIADSRQDLIVSHHRDYAVAEALKAWSFEDHRIMFQGPLADVSVDNDRIESAVNSVSEYLRGNVPPPKYGKKVKIDVSILDVHFVAFANILPAYRTAERKDFTPQQRQQWPFIVVALRKFLAAQADRQPVVEDVPLLTAMEPNICKALRIEILESGFTRPGTLANGALQSLLSYTLHICAQVYEDENKGGRGLGLRHLRRVSGQR